MISQFGMDHENHHTGHENGGYGGNTGWDMNHNYNPSSQHQSPVYEQNGFTFIQQPLHDVLPTSQAFTPQRMPILQPSPAHPSTQQLHPLIMPSHSTWPSMLTNPASYPPPTVTVPVSAAPPVVRGNGTRVATGHSTSTPRKTLTDSDRRRMCQYHLDNPSVKQTEIGAMFGVERSTVSKVVRLKDKYLGPENGSPSPVKRKGTKFPDIDRALAMWAKKMQQQGHQLTDEEIKDKASFFATTVHPNNESYLKINSAGWLEKFKCRNGIGGAKLTRRASETNVSNSGSLNPESAGHSASQTPNGISPTSPSGLPSPSPVSATKSEEDLKSEHLNGYFGHEEGGYRHSNSQSTTSLSSAFTDTTPPSFSGGPTSPSTPFAFSPDQSGSWLPSQQARLPPPGNFQRPRSQTFPMLGIDPSFISSQGNEPLTPKYNHPLTAPSSALDSPMEEMPPPYGMDSAISSAPLHSLHHSSSNGSMAQSSNGATITGLQSPPRSSEPSSPTQDDARRALDTLLAFLNNSTNSQGLVDRDEYLTVLKLTEKLRLNANNGPLPGGLHRIAEQDCEIQPKMEQSMSAGC